MKLQYSFKQFQSTKEIIDFLNLFEIYRTSFFTSKTWISQWLRHSQSTGNKYYLIFFHNNKPVGIAIFNEVKKTRRHFFKTTLLSMHDNDIDRYNFSIEYNEILADPAFIKPAINSLLLFLSSRKKFNEIQINGATHTSFTLLSEVIHNHSNLKLITEEVSTCRLVNLKDFPDFLTYHKFLSKKRKYQLRKSEENYNQYGEIEASVANNTQEAIKFFDELGVLHEKKWNTKGLKGAFSNKIWVDFHKDIISESFNQGKIILFKLSAGDTTIGILYIFNDLNKASVIQTGFLYDTSKYSQPGFLTHYYFIKYALSMNISEYNFLAGDSPYKKSLSTNSENLFWLTIQKKSLKFRIENLLLNIKRKVYDSIRLKLQ